MGKSKSTLFRVLLPLGCCGVIDMMRYDRATPFTQRDAAKLVAAIKGRASTDEERTVCFVSDLDQVPTVARWESFGIGVLEKPDPPDGRW